MIFMLWMASQKKLFLDALFELCEDNYNNVFSSLTQCFQNSNIRCPTRLKKDPFKALLLNSFQQLRYFDFELNNNEYQTVSLKVPPF